MTVGAASSSLIASVTADGSAIPARADAAVPETVTRLSGESLESSTAVTVTTPALVVSPAATVSVVAALSVKSPAAAFAPAAADTVTVTAAPAGRDSVAVTVAAPAAPPDSSIDAGDRTSATVGAASSSASVSAAPVTAPTPESFAAAAVTVALRPALPS